MGKWYIVDNCVAYCNEQTRINDFRTYISDTLKLINDNFATRFGGNRFKSRLSDLRKKVVEPTETADEIIGRMKDKLAKLGGEASGCDGTESDPDA